MVWQFEITAKSPSGRSVAAADAFEFAHNFDEIRDPVGSHVVLNGY
jgi:hypothetical protein